MKSYAVEQAYFGFAASPVLVWERLDAMMHWDCELEVLRCV